MTDDLVQDVRRSLADPKRVATLLGLKIEQASGGYVLVCCPVHGERNASCSLHRRSGTLAVRCHGCGWTGDVLHLVAAVRGLEPRRDFREVLAVAAELAGLHEQADAVRNGREPSPTPARPALPPEPERPYPPAAEVAELWRDAGPVDRDPEAAAMLSARGLDPMLVAYHDLARVLHPQTHETRLPPWARYRGKQAVSRRWTTTGHRMLVPAYDSSGAMVTVRAWRVGGDEETPKRVPPSGYRASGVVLANRRAQHWLRGERRPSKIVIAEGEPDHVARSITTPGLPVIGILSGSWTEEFAARVPYGCLVLVRSHLDEAGERYAEAIRRSIESRAVVRRWTEGEAA